MNSARQEAFSLLFLMEEVFERFIATYVVKNTQSLGLDNAMVIPQYRAKNSHLLRLISNGQNSAYVSVRPDLVIKDDTGIKMILDTKWKRLLKDEQDRRNGISMADIYQVYAYGQHFDCPVNVLLYPAGLDVSEKTYQLEASPSKRLAVKQVHLDNDLLVSQQELQRSLLATFTSDIH